MSAHQRKSRLTEAQKQSVECQRCFASVGKPCRGFSRGPFFRKDGQMMEIKVAHIERKNRAARKLAIEDRKS